MFTRKLALSVATAALLAASAMPTMAAPADPNDFRFYFNTILPDGVTGTSFDAAARTLSGYFTTNNSAGDGSGTLTGFIGTLGTTNVVTQSLSGTYTTSASTGVARLNALSFLYNVAGYPNTPYSNTLIGYTGAADSIDANITAFNQAFGGGVVGATIRPLLMPEINGGALPKGLFVIGGVFMMLFGRKKLSEV